MPWHKKDAWLADQQRWNDLTRDSPDDHDPEFLAVCTLFDEQWWTDLATVGYNARECGILYIHDAPALAELLDVPETFFSADARAFTDAEGAVVAPWPTTLAVTRLLAKTRADQLVALMAEKDQQAHHEATYGQYYPGRGKNPGTHISPETCAEVDRIYRPARDLLRQWCGAETAERLDELQALRTEVVRIGKLMEAAITCLRQAGQTAAASRFERELGIPLETLRHTLSGRD
ncbi:hypothetical protein CUT44_08835 [Streptomyces carminius]|uniref:Uncharacterized protein n=1 Tax=Streptomyces carminius TaxID=2665496 RepID=A0A2M8M1S0_9ACTN|nr:hypothetical protein CUT44_08835 [Streptomyces carminius]